MNKVLLYNHGGSANHGCEALARTVSAHIPADIERTLVSESPQEDIHYDINQIANLAPAMTATSKVSLDFWKAFLQLKIFGDYFGMDMLPYLKSIRAFGKNDIELSIGGDIYCYEDYKKYIRLHQLIRKRGCKTALIGCSLEEMLFSDEEFVQDMKSYDYITARESITYEMLKAHGMDRVSLIPDSAFSLPTVETKLPDEFKIGNTIGLNLSPLVVRKEVSPGIILDNYRLLIEHILKTTDSVVALIPHVVWKSNDDREVLLQLYEQFKQDKRVVLIEDQDCRRLKYVISKCKMFVGARTHATIAAYSTCVPTLVLGYSTKSRGIAQDLFGIEKHMVVSVKDVDKPDSILKEYRLMEKNEMDIRNQLVTVMPEYQKKVQKLSDVIQQLVRS